MKLRGEWAVVTIFIILLIAPALMAALPPQSSKPAPTLSAAPTPPGASIPSLQYQPNLGGATLAQLPMIDITAGSTTAFNLTLTNSGKTPDSYEFEISGAPGWASVLQGTTQVGAGETKRIAIVLSPSEDISGEFVIRVNAKSVNNPDVLATYDLGVRVLPLLSGGVTGFSIFNMGGTGAAIVGAVMLSVFAGVYYRRKTAERRKKVVGSLIQSAISKNSKTITAPVAEQFIREVYKPPLTPYIPRIERRAPQRLVPYRKERGKLLWEA